jgi:hypothetical protein
MECLQKNESLIKRISSYMRDEDALASSLVDFYLLADSLEDFTRMLLNVELSYLSSEEARFYYTETPSG